MYLGTRGAAPTGRPVGAGTSPAGRVSTTVVLLGVVSLLTDVSSEAVTAVLPLYLTAVLGFSPLAYGVVDAAAQGGTALVRLVGGRWADRGGRPKRVAATGYILSAVARAALLPATGVVAVTGAIAGDRLGKGLRTAPRDAMITAVSPASGRARALGVHRALDTTGALLGPVLAFAILALFPFGGGVPSVFVVSTAFAVVAIAVLLIAVPDVRLPRPARTGQAGPRTRLRDHRLWLAAGGLGLVTVGDGFLFLQLADRDGLALRWFPLLLVGASAAYLVLAVPFGRLADRVGRVPVFLGGHGLLVLAYLAAGGPVGGVGASVCCLVLLGAYYAATDGVLAALAGDLAPAHRRAEAIARAQTAVAMGRFVSSLAFGLVWTVVGRQQAVLVFAVALAAALPLAAWALRGLESAAR